MARHTLILVALVIGSLLLIEPFAAAQTGSQDDDQKQIQALEVFLPVMVFDKKNEFVPGLTKRNFRVFENGKEQTITSFDSPSQLPIDVAILIDTSNSVKRKLQFEKEAAAAFVLGILERRTDRALVA